MKKKFKLNVSVIAADINEGVTQSCRLCPIARALRRAFNRERIKLPDNDPFAVTMGTRAAQFRLGASTGKVQYLWEVPEEISNRVRRFDRGLGMEPFKFVATYVRQEPAAVQSHE